LPKVDPITFAVVQKKLISVANGMLETASSCGVTSFMGEVRDCSFAILDHEASVIAQSDGILLFLGSLSPATRNCIDYIGKETIQHGDIIISTLPPVTGSHTSDAMLFTPIFFQQELFGYASSKAHWQDLGARTTYPTDATSVFEEGLRIPPVKLFKKGQLQPEILSIIQSNSRAPEQVWGDIQAQIAGCQFAEKQVMELLDKYSSGALRDCIREMYDYAERVTRLAIEKLPDGVWTAEDFIDDNGIDLDKPVPIRVKVVKKGSDITLDFSDSAPEQKGPMNGLWVTTLSAARVAVKALTSPKLPANEGFNRPISVIVPKGCVYNAGPTAPSFLCGNVASTILELVNKALWQIITDKIPACSGGDVCGGGFFGVDPLTGKQWATLSSPRIGQGADKYADGDSFTSHHSIGGGGSLSFEVWEAEYPLLVRNSQLIPDSGGAGKQRGGPGMQLEVQLTAPAMLFRFIEKARAPHWGVDGGKPGLRNYAVVKFQENGQKEVLKTSGLPLSEGDVVTAVGGGGGGYGNPLKREPEAVRMDVVNGYITLKGAREDYGVVMDDTTFSIDFGETGKLRSEYG
jgi:N-methylhydantoinase B